MSRHSAPSTAKVIPTAKKNARHIVIVFYVFSAAECS
jgi:hypothetical protein